MPPQFDDDDDELLEGMDDDEAAPADPEFEQKYAEFMREVDKHISIVMKPKQHKPAERIASIQMLGELGEIKAIKPLVTLYQKDKTPGVKDAAAKSLGMFKALQQAIEDDDEDIREYANTLMDGIVRRRELGKPARFKPRTLRMILLGLTVSMVVLFGLGFVLSGDGDSGVVVDEPTAETAASPTTDPLAISSPIEVARQFSAYYVDLSQDIHTLQTQLGAVSQQYAPDCAIEFKNPAAVALPESLTTNTALASAAGALTGAGAAVSTIRDAYTAACADNALDTNTARDYVDDLVDLQDSLKDVTAQLSGIGIVVPPTGTPMTPTPPPTHTPTATITPSPVPAQLVNAQRIGLEQVIEAMSSTRGFNSNLLAYWTDVMTTGATGGCLNLPPPTLPEDYELPPALANVVPELSQAALNVNTGLELSRSSWQAFEAGCSADNLPQMAVQQQQIAQTAQDAFKEAQEYLDALDN